MQLIIKISLTTFWLILSFVVLKWTWTNNFDLKRSIKDRVENFNPMKGVLATREHFSIYKNEEIVGSVSKPFIDEDNNTISFEIITYDNNKIDSRNIFEPMIFRSYEFELNKIEFMSKNPPKIINAKGIILKKGI